MGKKALKSKSKRMPARRRYKIERKVREHNRKLRKEGKKNKKNSRKHTKDPGIPNSLPFKMQVIEELEERKKQALELKQRQREERQKLMNANRDLGDLVKDAERRDAKFQQRNVEMEETTAAPNTDRSLKAYYKEFQKVVEGADVVLQVLDARDPLGSRCAEVERAVLNSGTDKRLVLVLNKIDLVPSEVLQGWLKYLKNEFPIVPFKASTQTQKSGLARDKLKLNDASLKTSKCLGAELLMKLLGNYCRNKDIKTNIRVGVVGFPNVGKSSVINSLKRSRACNIGATPGVTKVVQEVHLDKHVVLLDSPGIVMAKDANDASSALRNAVKVETLSDPITPVESILQRANKDDLILHYKLPNFNSTHEFLGLLAKRQGRLKKGGIPDTEKAARIVLQDWNSGKIRYYTHPPETHSMPTHVSAEIVSTMEKEFDIDALLKESVYLTKNVKSMKPGVAIKVSGITEFAAEFDPSEVVMDSGVENSAPSIDFDDDVDDGDDDDYSDMDSDDTDTRSGVGTSSILSDSMTVNIGTPYPKKKEKKIKFPVTKAELKAKKAQRKEDRLTKRQKTLRKTMAESELKLQDGNKQSNKAVKRAAKAAKKQEKKRDKVASSLAESLDTALSFGKKTAEAADYDFDVDFK